MENIQTDGLHVQSHDCTEAFWTETEVWSNIHDNRTGSRLAVFRWIYMNECIYAYLRAVIK